MAFTSTILTKTVFGNMKVRSGTFDGTSVTTGTVSTGLKNVRYFSVQREGTTVLANSPVVNRAASTASDINIVFDSGAVGRWFCYGN